MAFLRCALLTAAAAFAVTSIGCSSPDAGPSCEEAHAALAACTSPDQPECADDSPAAQAVTSETCSAADVAGKADTFGNRTWGQACTWNWQCQQDSRHSCVQGTCYLRADVGNRCDRRDDRDCESGLSCADDLSTPSNPGGVCQTTSTPVRPALHAETLRPNETAEFEGHAFDIMGIQMRNAVKRLNGDDKIRRTFHAKHHACVPGRFEVLGGIASELAVGPVFGQPQTFDAYLRFSNGTLTIGADDSSPVTGLALKLVGVPGDKLLESSRNAVTQDFLLINMPALPTVNANDFIELTKAQEQGGAALVHFLVTHPRLALRLLPLASRKTASVRTETYWAGGANMHGTVAVKYSAKPCAGTAAATATSGANKLRDELTPHLASNGLCFEFFAQPQRDSVKQPIEDTSVAWDPALGQPVKIARITVPPTALGTAATNAVESSCDALSFNPWNGSPVHRPLGHVNRSRKHAYEASRQMRGAAPEPTHIP